MPRYFLGVDTGGTKSHALIAGATGHALGYGKGGPGNATEEGYDRLTEVLSEILNEALARAGIGREQIAGAGFGIAGYDWPSERDHLLRAIEPLGLNAPVEVVNDADLGYLAGTAEGWGVTLVAGTGCNCRGRDRNGRVGRMTGYGALMGEGAGAVETVARAVTAAAREWTQRGPATQLSPAFIEYAGARDLADLLEGLTLRRYRLGPPAAPLVFQVAQQGDAVAMEVIRWAGRELGDMAVGVIRQLEFETVEFEIVLAGSFFEGGPRLTDPLREAVLAAAPHARFVRLAAPPVVGGVVLGMQMAGLATAAVREALISTTNDLLKGERNA